jgi:hypothetical protein
MKKFLIPLLVVVALGLSALFVGKSFFGGDETESDWQTQTVDEIGVSFKHPTDTTFRKEIAQDSAGIHTAGFYVEKEGYTLYGVYQPGKEATEQNIELSKKEMDPSTIKEVTIGGYKGIEGLILGPKTRYITILLKNSRLFTISTFPPTNENKALTDQILPTFSFK